VDPTDGSRLLQRANRDYLLRGCIAGGTFHPKTCFFGNASGGVLLVGSGNLSLRGIEQGHEVFCRFDSQDERELQTIRGWRDWAEAIVARTGDQVLHHRWLDLKARTGEWLLGLAEGSSFISNLERSMLEQLAERSGRGVDELHVLAPFYDEKAKALSDLVDALEPARLVVYLGAGTSVDGSSLAALLDALGDRVDLRGFEPSEFIHAKLVGTVQGEQGWLLSGSANLSRAAFTASVAGHSYANVEAGVLTEAHSEVVRAAFSPLGLSPRPETLALVEELEYSADAPGLAAPLRLLAARPRDDGCVSVSVVGTRSEAFFLTAGIALHSIEAGATTEPLSKPEGGALVWLCSADGSPLSNKVLLDDPTMLHTWLAEPETGADRPRELDPLDIEQPVGELLVWLHQECIFDIDETPAGARIGRRMGEETEGSEGVDWSFVEELAKEELRLDPRVDRYRHARAGLPDDEVFDLLQLMLDKTPGKKGLHLVYPVARKPEPGKEGTPWTMEKRLEVRVFNVLQRWCSALADPRFLWIERTAPVRNYTALLIALTRCWEEEFLPVDRVLRLFEALMTSFVGTERVRGYLLTANEDERKQALARMPDEARSLAAVLTYGALYKKAELPKWVFRFQPFLVPALELGVVQADEDTSVPIERLIGERPSLKRIEDVILEAATYIDDPHWCEKQERELGIERVELTNKSFSPRFGITLAVQGISIDDPRLVSLVRQALRYRGCEGAIVELGPNVIAAHLDEPIGARINGETYEGTEAVTRERLMELERAGMGFSHLVVRTGALAS